VFDRRKTIALARANDGTVTGWNPTFGAVMLDLALGVELCPEPTFFEGDHSRLRRAVTRARRENERPEAVDSRSIGAGR